MLENTNLSGGEILKSNDIMRSEVKVVQTSEYRHLCNIKIASLSSNSSAGRKALGGEMGDEQYCVITPRPIFTQNKTKWHKCPSTVTLTISNG